MAMEKRKSLLLLLKFFLILLIFLAGAGAGLWFKKTGSRSAKPQDPHLAFLFEVYEKIQENYWDKVSDQQLVDLYLKATEKLVGQPQVLKEENKENLRENLEAVLEKLEEEEKKKEFSSQLADIVLANLKPFGRSRIYTKKEEKALADNVKNVAAKDHYQVLEVDKEVDPETIQGAYEEKKQALEPEIAVSEVAKKEYERVLLAYRVLSDEISRHLYDEKGVDPTMDYHLLNSRILYLHHKKFSPTSLEELQKITEKVDNQEGLDTLIYDLRDNIGGSIDLLPYFLGPFIGKDQYAYQFLHQDEKTDFKTRIGWLNSLVRYKKVIILINENTQSSAEVAAAVLKKYNAGLLMGKTTRGWGTVEQVFKIDNQLSGEESYSIFLVHSLTLRDDGQPIEGKGVDPLISLEDDNWEAQLLQYFHYPELIKAIKEVTQTP